MQTSSAFWEAFHAGETHFSGRPNAALVAEVADLRAGTALDLGCAKGTDAIWLAGAGWTVTAVDVSATALQAAAAAPGGDRVRWERHDLAVAMPDGPFDLVVSSYLHAPPDVELPRARILRDAAARVAPGGTLLVIGHPPQPQHPDRDLPGVAATLALLPRWPVVTAEERHDADRGRDDVVVRLRRP